MHTISLRPLLPQAFFHCIMRPAISLYLALKTNETAQPTQKNDATEPLRNHLVVTDVVPEPFTEPLSECLVKWYGFFGHVQIQTMHITQEMRQQACEGLFFFNSNIHTHWCV